MVTTKGSAAAVGVRAGFGGTSEWDPIEGARYLVLGTGDVADLDVAFDPMSAGPYMACNRDLGAEFDPGASLPAPLAIDPVAGNCEHDPTLVGTGDCSKSIFDQFTQGGSANDYTEARIRGRVPQGVTSIGYAFAFFSTEYPIYYGTEYNDLFVGWLESESWTGNVSFDGDGAPISLNAGFLDFKDDAAAMPELAGTCMSGHAGTKWLSTTAPVTAGEELLLVLAIFDLSDSQLDSYVFVDDVHFGCEGGPPETIPEG